MPFRSFIPRTASGRSRSILRLKIGDQFGQAGLISHALRDSISPGRLTLLAVLVMATTILSLVWSGDVAEGALQVTTTPVTTVSAASFETTPVAPDSIVAAFGASLANQTVVASDIDTTKAGIQLPTSLGGSTVEVGGKLAEILFVSPGQTNYIVPATTTPGLVPVIIRAASGTVSNGTVSVARVAPGVFTANSSGRGAAAAFIIRVRTDGTQSYEPVADFNQQTSQFITRPIDLGPVGERVFLVLFLSGLRGATDTNGDGNLNESVSLLVGGSVLTPLYAGRQPEFLGLDQVNAEIPRDLLGRGLVNLTVAVANAQSSNPVEIEVGGIVTSAGISGPIVSGFDAATTLAGQQLQINGSGFSANLSENIVRISGKEAEVVTATASQLKVVVPYGVSSGVVQVKNQSGEGSSSTVLNVRTSISGIVEDTLRNPIIGLTVRLSGTTIKATTSEDGTFVLADVVPGVHLVEIDGGLLNASPPFPLVTLKTIVYGNRDNPFQKTIAIQQATGSSATIGTSGTVVPVPDNLDPLRINSPEQASTIIQTDNVQLQVQPGASATFPNGQYGGRIWLTKLEGARTFVSLPYGYYSPTIVQITPFNVRIEPGAKLTFPNTDALAPGTKLTLFRFSDTDGTFLPESTEAVVTPDGRSIETGLNAIKITSAYFVANLRQTTTIVGRVVESDGTTPVRSALANFRGQQSTTDGTGSFAIRSVPAWLSEKVKVEISLQRPGGRVDRATSAEGTAVPGGITLVPLTRLPDQKTNRSPGIIASTRLSMVENSVVNHTLIVSDPDQNQTVNLSIQGPPFATLVRPSTTNSKTYAIRLAPGLTDAGTYSIVVNAVDNLGATSSLTISLQVLNLNQLPQVFNLNLSGTEDTNLSITLEAFDNDQGDQLNFIVESSPTNGTLSGNGKNLVYSPRANYFGSDLFTYRASDGQGTSELATVTIVIAPVNDPPVLILPAEQTFRYGTSFVIEIRATDVEPDQTLRITTGQLPSGVSFNQTQPGAGVLSWKPTTSQIGSHTITFSVTDNGLPPATTSGILRVNIQP